MEEDCSRSMPTCPPALAGSATQREMLLLIVATEGTSSTPKTVITMLSGVEPILRQRPVRAKP